MFFHNKVVYELSFSENQISFKTNCFPFCCETHIQQGINIGLNSKHCCQSLITLAFKLGRVALVCKTLTQRQLQNSSQPLFSLSSTRLIITTQQVSVFVMKPQLVVLLGLQSIFHDTFHYSSIVFC